METVTRPMDIPVEVMVSIARDYAPDLRATTKGFVARCPFHQELTPSFFINAEKRYFHCFGCGAGGDVFSLVSRAEGVSFDVAAAKVAERNKSWRS